MLLPHSHPHSLFLNLHHHFHFLLPLLEDPLHPLLKDPLQLGIVHGLRDGGAPHSLLVPVYLSSNSHL